MEHFENEWRGFRFYALLQKVHKLYIFLTFIIYHLKKLVCIYFVDNGHVIEKNVFIHI